MRRHAAATLTVGEVGGVEAQYRCNAVEHLQFRACLALNCPRQKSKAAENQRFSKNR